MRKIPTLFVRDEANRSRVTEAVTPGCEWVLAKEGVATAKWDGTCVQVTRGSLFWKRRELTPGDICPEGFVRQGDPDPVTGTLLGWVWVSGDRPEDQWAREAYAAHPTHPHVTHGTYELCGPKVQGNPHGFSGHVLIPHGQQEVWLPGRSVQAIRVELECLTYEGIVFWHEDGRKAKIKRRDLGLPWPIKEQDSKGEVVGL